MLAKIAPKFVISRVIQNAYYADYMAVELVKEIIAPELDNFYTSDPKKYFVPECPLRNATFTATSRRCQPPQNSATSFKNKSTWRQWRSSGTTMRLGHSWKSLESLWLSYDSSTGRLKLAILAIIYWPGPLKLTL